MVNTGVGHEPEHMVMGATLTTLSFFCVATMSALGKVAGELTSTGVVVLFQNLICFVFIAPIALRGGRASLRTDKIGLHILRAATGTACWYAVFVAITMMPLTNAILLSFSAPLWMPAIAWLVSRQKASMATWFGAALGFVGVVLVLQPHHQRFNVGTLLALAAAVLLALALMSVRWLAAPVLRAPILPRLNCPLNRPRHPIRPPRALRARRTSSRPSPFTTTGCLGR